MKSLLLLTDCHVGQACNTLTEAKNSECLCVLLESPKLPLKSNLWPLVCSYTAFITKLFELCTSV